MISEQNGYGEYSERQEARVFGESNVSNEAVVINEAENINDEYGNEQLAVQPSEKTKKSSDANKFTKYGALTAAAGVVAAVFFVVTIFSGGASGIVASILNTVIYGTSYDYSLSVSLDYTVEDDSVIDFSNIDTGLVLITVNSTQTISTPLVISSESVNKGQNAVSVENTDEENAYKVTYTFNGTVDGLESGTRYKVQIIGDEEGKTVVYDSTEIKTLGGAITEFKSILWKCNCGIDDTFRFSLDYVDENGFYSDFSYSLRRDEDGSSAVFSGEITEPKAEQVISGIRALPGKNYILTVSYYSNAYTDTGDASGVEKVLKTVNVAVIL